MEFVTIGISIIALLVAAGSLLYARTQVKEAKRANDLVEGAQAAEKHALIRLVDRLHLEFKDDRLRVVVQVRNDGKAIARDVNFVLELGSPGDPLRYRIESLVEEFLEPTDRTVLTNDGSSSNAYIPFFSGKARFVIGWKDDASDVNLWSLDGTVQGMRGEVDFFFDGTTDLFKVR